MPLVPQRTSGALDVAGGLGFIIADRTTPSRVPGRKGIPTRATVGLPLQVLVPRMMASPRPYTSLVCLTGQIVLVTKKIT